MFLCLAFTTTVLVVARWDVLSVFIRPVLGIATTLFLPFGIRSVRRYASSSTLRSSTWRLIGALSIPTAMIGVTLIALVGYRSPGVWVDLSLPLRDGRFYVVQGGASRVINHHYPDRTQKFAVDIDEIDDRGNRGSISDSASVRDYRIYGKAVFSPCEGRVRNVRDGLPDEAPPNGSTRYAGGNFVAIDCDDVTVFLAHLRPGSITVSAGQVVHLADQLGEVGNSGNSSEPHLHVHAARNAGSDGLGGIGVAIRFHGRFLVRNSLISN
jgi:murein DD-endopeptidase MepM/ murein hydrolase activator NlpD